METVIRLFLTACESVKPGNLVKEAIRLHNGQLKVGNRCYQLSNNVYVAGFGKAAMGMSTATEEILGPHIVRGIVSIPLHTKETFAKNTELRKCLPRPESIIEYLEGAEHNIPDLAAYQSAMKIKALALNLTENDILMVLVSGGGSALLPAPVDGVSLDEKQKLIKSLSTAGASIEDLNVVRQNLSQLKRGGLAALAYPAKVISLIFSDIIGNPLSLIASGPTVPPESDESDALKIIDRYKLRTVGESIRSYLEQQVNARKTQHQSFEHVQNVLIGDNLKALNAAAKEAELLGMKTLIVTDSVIGEASTIGSEYAKLTQWLINTTTLSDISTLKTFVSPLLVGNNELTEKLRSTVIDCFTEKKTLVLLFGGETTVSVKGDGIGGRNQELSLAYLISMAKFLAEQERLKLPDSFITYLSCGTDGQDGPTGAAGVGLVPLKDCQMLPDQLEQMISMGTSMLNDNNSNEFWKKFANGTRLIETGLTGTNVMDVQILQFDFAKVLGSC